MNTQKILSRLSFPGLALMALGAVTILQAERLLTLVLGDKGQRWILPFKCLGLALCLLGALILLDVIPGL